MIEVVVNGLARFKEMSDGIAVSRPGEELADVGEKVYTRDIFWR